ncbi:LodA/GoxA family CTQ-dependent oxidase, partial [Leptolyngbya cf. ectocarpi LEGE 11479]
MNNQTQPKFRIYPSIGIARIGNGPAEKECVIFSPEIPWANLFEVDNDYLTEDGRIKKQAQRFYIYACDDEGNPVGQIEPDDYNIEWTVEVANKKPFWYDFNNSLDLSIQLDNHQNLSPRFFDDRIAPAISTRYRNPNVLDEGKRKDGARNYRHELVNSPPAVSVDSNNNYQKIGGQFPFPNTLDEDGKDSQKLISKLAKKLGREPHDVNLGTIEYDNGMLIFYAADGLSGSLNPSDLNTDFADNSNWYDDICDGRVTARITHKTTQETY